MREEERKEAKEERIVGKTKEEGWKECMGTRVVIPCFPFPT